MQNTRHSVSDAPTDNLIERLGMLLAKQYYLVKVNVDLAVLGHPSNRLIGQVAKPVVSIAIAIIHAKRGYQIGNG
jgi:hypothetical protein